MLASGNDKVTPTNSMWPLVCNEVGLSYDQEERVRHFQRTMILQDPNTWLDRHTSRSSSLLMQSFHDSLGSMAQVLRQRDARGAKRILSHAQRIKFLSWAEKNAHRIKSKVEGRRQAHHQEDKQQAPMDIKPKDGAREKSSNKYEVKNDHHVAANLYILNHKLQEVLNDFAFKPAAMVTAAALKKLSRRPSFESLGQQKDAEMRALCREDSFASSGSLKNSTSMQSLEGVEDQERAAPTNQITPEDGEQAAAPTVDAVLGFVKPIIPPIDPPTAVEDVQPTPTWSAPFTATLASPPVLHIQAPPHSQEYAAHDQHPPQPAIVAPAPPTQYVVHVQASGQVPLQQYHYAPPVAGQHHPVAPADQVPQHPPPPYEQTYQQHSILYHSAPHQQQPQLVATQSAPGQYTLQQAPPLVPMHLAPAQPSPAFQQAPAPVRQQQNQTPRHVRKSSFLPPHLNVVAEDIYGDGSAEDFFVGLMDEEDWAIGEGVDMDTRD
jgi:hypothetical protein